MVWWLTCGILFAMSKATAVSNHVVGLALSRAIIDLAARPEYLAPLRQEIEDAIQEDGYELGDNGQKDLKKTTYVKLRKLDSFLKESQRLFPAKLGECPLKCYHPWISTAHNYHLSKH